MSLSALRPSRAAARREDEPPVLLPVPDAEDEWERSRSRRAVARHHAVAAALRALGGASTVSQLLRLVPTELCRCEFSRALVSLLDDSTWTLCGVHHVGGSASAEARLLERASSGALVRASHEAETMRRRRGVLVCDAREDARVDPRVAEMFRPTSYAIAPIVVDSQVVALLHADRPGSSIAVDAEDRELLTVFAEGVAHALTRVILGERLQRLRCEVRTLTRSVGDLVDDRCFEPLALSHSEGSAEPGETPPPAIRAGVPSASGSRLMELLTGRELEVLRLMATGETNAGIAEQLVISQGTVKSHVKNVLRKLHAANRAQAVSRYFRLVRTDGEP